MTLHSDDDLRALLACYTVPSPSPELLRLTARRMRRELALAASMAPAPSIEHFRIFLLVGLALCMTLCLFYLFTVGTVLRLVLPANLLIYLTHSLVACTGIGAAILLGAFGLVAVKEYQMHPRPLAVRIQS